MEIKKMYADIPIGRGNAIGKDILGNKWGMDERAVRKVIQELRSTDFGDDYVIISSCKSKGYYKSDKTEDIAAFKKEVINRGRHTFLPLKKVNRILEQFEEDNNFQKIRKEKDFTNSDVVIYMESKFKGFDKSLLSKIETGKCMPTKEQIIEMAKLYEVTPEELSNISVL